MWLPRLVRRRQVRRPGRRSLFSFHYRHQSSESVIGKGRLVAAKYRDEVVTSGLVHTYGNCIPPINHTKKYLIVPGILDLNASKLPAGKMVIQSNDDYVVPMMLAQNLLTFTPVPAQHRCFKSQYHLQCMGYHHTMFGCLPFRYRKDMLVPDAAGSSLRQWVEVTDLQQEWVLSVFTDKTRLAP